MTETSQLEVQNLHVTIDGKEAGSELAVRSGAELTVDIHAVSAIPISRIDIMHQGRVLKQIDVDPGTDIRRTETMAPSATLGMNPRFGTLTAMIGAGRSVHIASMIGTPLWSRVPRVRANRDMISRMLNFFTKGILNFMLSIYAFPSALFA